MVWLFCPTIVFSAIDRFNGYGGFIFVGLGAAVLGFSPTYQKNFITDVGRDFWIMVRAPPHTRHDTTRHTHTTDPSQEAYACTDHSPFPR